MRHLIIISILSILAFSAYAETLRCHGVNGNKADFVRAGDKNPTYDIARVDIGLSTPYWGEILSDQGLSVSLDKKRSNTKTVRLDLWEGSLGVALRLPRAVVDNYQKYLGDKTFPAHLTILYNDRSEDSVENDLVCTVEE